MPYLRVLADASRTGSRQPSPCSPTLTRGRTGFPTCRGGPVLPISLCARQPVPRRAWISAARRSHWRTTPPTGARVCACPKRTARFPLDALPISDASLTALSDLRPLGQLHESFIIAAGRDGLWIIDQHVAHERILFERVLKQRAAGNVETQRLLMPLILQLTPGSRSNTRASPTN